MCCVICKAGFAVLNAKSSVMDCVRKYYQLCWLVALSLVFNRPASCSPAKMGASLNFVYLAVQHILYINFSIGIYFGERNAETPAILHICTLAATHAKHFVPHCTIYTCKYPGCHSQQFLLLSYFIVLSADRSLPSGFCR